MFTWQFYTRLPAGASKPRNSLPYGIGPSGSWPPPAPANFRVALTRTLLSARVGVFWRPSSRAKRFYEKLGFRLDIDYAANEDYRVIQFTPPGSEAAQR